MISKLSKSAQRSLFHLFVHVFRFLKQYFVSPEE